MAFKEGARDEGALTGAVNTDTWRVLRQEQHPSFSVAPQLRELLTFPQHWFRETVLAWG